MLKPVFFLLLLGGLAAEPSDPCDIVKISEAMGHMIGKNLEALGFDLDLDAVVRGLKEESEGKMSPLTEDECVQIITALQEGKMLETIEKELETTDAISNGDEIPDDEDHTFPTSDPAKYR